MSFGLLIVLLDLVIMLFGVIVLLGFFVCVCLLRAWYCLFSLAICGFVMHCWCSAGLLRLLLFAFLFSLCVFV